MLPFNPDDGIFPSALEALCARPAATIPAVLLIAGEEARRTGWAARAAIALAAGWADRRGDVVLADLVGEKELIELSGDEGAEGIADVLEFGLSLRRVTQSLPDHGFRLIPAGPYLPVASGLLEHPRWGRLIAQFAEEQATLLAYAAMGSVGLDTLARRIGKAIVLAGPDEAGRITASLPSNCSITLVLQQPDDFVAALLAAAQEAGLDPAELGDVGPLDGEVGAAGAGEDNADKMGAAKNDPLLTEPTFIQRRQPRRRTSPLVWIGLIATLGVGAWFGAEYLLERMDGARPPGAGAGGAGGPMALAETEEPGDPVETPAPFSIAIEAYPDLSTAHERVDYLRDADPGIGFFMTPIVRDGAIYYRVMAGPAADSISAVALMHRLVQRGHKTDADVWSVRPTTWAYHLGDYDSPSAAAARVDALAGQGIPAYTVEIATTSGQARHRVYAGAYEAMTQAEVMGELLKRAGIEAPLIRRTGRSVE